MSVVTALHVHPIKGCRPLPVARARVTRRGLEDDRRYMVVGEDGRFLSQRDVPELGVVRVAIDGDALVVDDALSVPRDGVDGPRRVVTVFGHACDAVEHEVGSAWFSRRLGRPCALVFQPDATERPVNPARGRPGDHVSFADGYPLLLCTTASLDELSRRAGVPVAMARFRPNVVTTAPAPFAEDRWAQLAIGAVSFRNVKPCDRCSVTTIDPETRRVGKEPLRTLATFRARDGAVWFGSNLVPDGEGAIAVGDAIAVLAEQPVWIDAAG